MREMRGSMPAGPAESEIMTIYLIDYENTKKAGMNGIEGLKPDDSVCVFYSENANTLTFDMHRKISESNAKFTFESVGVGTKNSLDFQLVTFLGWLIGQNGDRRETYRIVSRDKGFLNVCKFWKARGFDVELVADLAGKNEEVENAQLQTAIASATGEEQAVAKKIADIIQKYKTKQGINNAMMRAFPSADNRVASAYYKAIKPLLKDKKGE